MIATQSHIRGVLLAFLAYAVYAFSDASVKILHGAVPAYQAAFIGAVLGIVALPFIKGRGDRWSDMVATSNRWLWLLRFVCAAIGSIASIIAFTKLPMAEAFCLLFLLPCFVTILSVIFLKEDVRWQRWAAVIIGFLGVLVVLRPGFRELSIGHLAAATGGLVAAISIVAVRALGPAEKLLSLYGSALLGILFISGVLMVSDLTVPTAQEWLFLAGYGLFGALGNVFAMTSARMAPASLVAPPQYSQMIWAIGFGYFIFNDSVDMPMAFGIALIICSGLLTLVRERKRGTPLPTPVLSTDSQAALATTKAATSGNETEAAST
ncbi:DMT family transporter [Neorhizobium sp. P12A]|jgi:drug/metabolite transporter (DMT)-like permease|uniref:DMT family transporter n=1 Tax=Neorhizobium sp. P12A TaxID=2268027 RepID=UPI0011ECC68A|nr:DMT family transporter [Neorhizobium sp. P12A]KAA0689553.1 DMT family transporter [Neorhizobium sp. P12A]